VLAKRVVADTVCVMQDVAGERIRLGLAVRRRRTELGLSVAAAARAATINRATWSALEQAARDTETYIHGRIEQVLGWSSGTIDNIRSGQPNVLEVEHNGGASPDLDELIRMLREVLGSRFGDATKISMIRDIVDDADAAYTTRMQETAKRTRQTAKG